MILSDERNLEALVIDEIANALNLVRDSPLAEKLSDFAEIVETISPVIEQQIDSESYESTEYSIDLPGYSSSSYDAGKYYDLVKDDAGETIGASITEVFSDYEHRFLEEAQEIATNTREGKNTNHPFVEPQVDTNQKYIKEQIKLVSKSTWEVMYYGKIKFN
ncbi:MAG: hypothetical protein QW165_04775 [Candidatus Woesearchaeota archaeon]